MFRRWPFSLLVQLDSLQGNAARKQITRSARTTNVAVPMAGVEAALFTASQAW